MNQTLRETPAASEVVGHQLLLQAGFVRQLAAGVFSYLHLGQRMLQKLEAIMRQEMNGLGGQEIKMPLLHPAALWQSSGRWYEIDAELGRLVDRNGREFTMLDSYTLDADDAGLDKNYQAHPDDKLFGRNG